MKIRNFTFVLILCVGCSITEKGVSIDFPRPTVDVCVNSISNDQLIVMKSKIDGETFRDEKMSRAKMLTRERCILTSQVVLLMDCFTFDSDKLELAKFLYNRTDDKHNYDVVVDALEYRGSKEELRDYIDSQ